jgi:hypothetical protein
LNTFFSGKDKCRDFFQVLVAIAMFACATPSAAALELTEHNLQVTEAATPMSQKVTGTNFGDSIIFRWELSNLGNFLWNDRKNQSRKRLSTFK